MVGSRPEPLWLPGHVLSRHRELKKDEPADGSAPSGVWNWETELVVGVSELKDHDLTEIRR